LVVGVRVDDRLARSPELRSHEERKEPAQRERADDGAEVHDADALVVQGQEPRRETLLVGQIVVARAPSGSGDRGGSGGRRHVLIPYFCSLMKAMRPSIFLSLSLPLNVGMAGGNP